VARDDPRVLLLKRKGPVRDQTAATPRRVLSGLVVGEIPVNMVVGKGKGSSSNGVISYKE